MMGTKIRNFSPLPNLSLEQLVPQANFYRCLEATLDLSFVRELVKDCYASSGRPSVDPVVFFRLQLVMFFEDIRSERRLMEVAADRLSIRWFLGYDINLLGREEDWHLEGRTIFECDECGRSITLLDRLDEVQPSALIGGPDEEAESVRDLLRSLKPPFGRG